MRPLARMLDDRYFVVNADLPGHGQTPPPESAYGVPQFAGEVADLIRTEMQAPVTIAGHSNGGRIALFMASDPNLRTLIKRLILISPSGMKPSRPPRYFLKKGLAGLLKAPFSVLPRKLKNRGLHWLRESALWRSLGSSDYRALKGVMRETFVKTVTTHLDEIVHRIEVPTLIFWGNNDTEIRREQIDRLVEAIPDAGLVVLNDAGHYGYLDDPRTVEAGIRHFMEHS